MIFEKPIRDLPMKFLLVILIFAASFCNFVPAQARAVVFVINSSQSMNIADPFHAVPESVIWSAENLADGDEVAIITFGENPAVVRPLSKLENAPVKDLQINYDAAETNASAALLHAVDILSKKFNTEKAIIFFNDGENLLDESTHNRHFVENFNAGLRQAKEFDTSVYIFSLRADDTPQNYHSYSGAKEIPVNYLDLMTAVRTLIHNDFRTPHIQLSTSNLSEGILIFENPIESPDHLKISLLSSSPGTAALKNIQPYYAVNKNFVKIFALNYPATNKFALDTKFPQGNGVTLDVITEVRGKILADITTQLFEEKFLEITPVYVDKSNKKILGAEFFENKPVTLRINDENITGIISGGIIKVALADDAEEISLQKINFEDLGVIFIGDDTAQISVPSNNFGACLAAFAAIMTILALSWRLQRKNHAYASVLSHEFSYRGKLVIFVTDIQTGENFEPREFNLFRLNVAQISLAEILKGCHIDEDFQGVDGILIKPAESGILLENNSNCTFTKKSELIENGARIEFYYDDALEIVTENFKIVLTYKKIKFD